MRVLWFTCTPSLYDEKQYGGWCASLERIVKKYCQDIELGIAFEHPDKCFKEKRNGVTYYPMNSITSLKRKWDLKLHHESRWKLLRPMCLKAIHDFCPDIIQCFGSEWPFALLAEDLKGSIPIVVHMQGFSNIYNMSSRMALRTYDLYKYHHYNPFSMFHFWYRSTKRVQSNNQEKRLMAANRYFMGRTEWDKNIVHYFCPEGTYYHCPEAIRPEFTHTDKFWKYSSGKKMQLITISSASSLKGNGLILQTANILKEMGIDFEWRVTGDEDSFKLFESIHNLNHKQLNITLLGKIDAKRIVEELCVADAYVHTAIIDNSPNSLCEAQLIGCPVVSTNVGGIAQLVENNISGILYPYNEPYTLAFTLMNLFKNPLQMKALSENEIKQARERHDENKIAHTLVSIYRDILQKNPYKIYNNK